MASAVTKEKELYSGKTSCLTFEAFDEKVITWCRKKYGDAYAVGLWKNELDDIYNLDLANEEDSFSFELQCAKVYDVLCRTSVKNADWLGPSGRRNTRSSFGNRAANRSSVTSKSCAQGKRQGSCESRGSERWSPCEIFSFEDSGPVNPNLSRKG